MNIKIKEKEFTLEYNNRALFNIEKETGVSIIKLFNTPEEMEKLHTIYAIIWGGIKEKITFDEFSELASVEDCGKVLPDVIKVIGDSFDTGSKKK